MTEHEEDLTERRSPERAAGRVECARDSITLVGPDGKERDLALTCRDQRAFHDPCSRCACPAFVEPPTPELVIETPEPPTPDVSESAHAPRSRRRRRRE